MLHSFVASRGAVPRQALSVLADVALLILATLAALLLRDNLVVSADRAWELTSFLIATVIAGLLVYPASSASRGFWRFSALPDYRNVIFATLIAVFLATALTFAWDRLTYVARSLPIMQFVFAVVLQVATRAIFRSWRAHRSGRVKGAPLRTEDLGHRTPVLVVGLNRLAEVYLQSVEDLARERILVVGLLGTRERHVGRLMAETPVLGVAEDVATVLRDLEPHGTIVERIVVVADRDTLTEQALEALHEVERTHSIELQFFAEQLDFVPRLASRQPAAITATPLRFVFEPDLALSLARRPYWAIKRMLDVLLSAALLIVLAPVILLAAVLSAYAVGFPITFWQLRPGMHGRTFRLLKFRTMRAAHDENGRLLADDERVSAVGNFIRRTRLDELPQLINILKGDMSFVGPRPLLPCDQDPCDQDPCDQARLLVRPGLTGWAQVVGGRTVSAQDKAALDVWYVKNASLLLDLRVALKTIPMVVVGETLDNDKIVTAWRDLVQAGILSMKPAGDGRSTPFHGVDG